MTFVWPLALAGLVAIPLLVGLYVLAARRRRRQAARFANPALVPNLVAASPAWRRYVPPALALVALALLVVGIARPHVVRDVTRDEATVVLAIDVSRSMAATDVQPNRFEAAKRAAQAFLDEVPEVVQRRHRLVLDLRRSGSPSDDRPRGRTSRAGRAAPRLRHRDRERRRALRRARARTGRRAAAAAARVRRRRQRCCSCPTAPRRRATSGRSRPLSARAGSASRSRPWRSARARPWSRSRGPEASRSGSSSRPDVQTLRLIANTTGGTFSEAPSAARLESVYRELGTRLATDRKRVEVTSAFAAGGAVLLLVGSALSSFWFRRAL